MKALETIGIAKALRFIYYGWLVGLLHISLPPVRMMLLRIFGAHIGADTIIMDVRFANLYHYGFKKIRIGNRCFIGDEVLLDARGGILLEDEVTISNRVSVVTHINVGYPQHPLQRTYPSKEAKVVIQKGAYIGTGAILLPGITIGRESVVGAGAVVTKDVAASTVVVGTPAREVKKLR